MKVPQILTSRDYRCKENNNPPCPPWFEFIPNRNPVNPVYPLRQEVTS